MYTILTVHYIFLSYLVEMYSEEFCDSLGISKRNRLLPSKHDVISCLAVGGRWITAQHDLQVSKIFYLRFEMPFNQGDNNLIYLLFTVRDP